MCLHPEARDDACCSLYNDFWSLIALTMVSLCSIQELLIHIDHALQYGEDLEVNTRKMDQEMEDNDD